MNNQRSSVELLAVGIVQTTINASLAWGSDSRKPKMSVAQDDHVWMELCKAMRAFHDGGLKPKLVLFPELTLPRTRLPDFARLVCSLNVIAFIGADYHLNSTARIAKNQGIVFIPKGFFRDRPSRYCSRVVFGKTYPAPKEKTKLERLNPSWSFHGDQNVYVFDCGQYGHIGVSICYDFMDIERALMYRGKIEHLFVLAYNRDLTMFRSLADSLSRTVFCNVVICNTGHFGGSLAVSPYYEAHRRTLYSHEGRNLFTTQIVELPVGEFIKAKKGKAKKYDRTESIQEFKDPPPGLLDKRNLRRRKIEL